MFHLLNSTCPPLSEDFSHETGLHPKLGWLYITTYAVPYAVTEQYFYSSTQQMQPSVLFLLHKLIVAAGSRPLVPKSEGSTLLSSQKDYCCSGTAGGDEMSVKCEWKSWHLFQSNVIRRKMNKQRLLPRPWVTSPGLDYQCLLTCYTHTLSDTGLRSVLTFQDPQKGCRLNL